MRPLRTQSECTGDDHPTALDKGVASQRNMRSRHLSQGECRWSIAFLDGHVEYYKSLQGEDGRGVLLDYVTQKPTTDIQKAIGPRAVIVKPILGNSNGG